MVRSSILASLDTNGKGSQNQHFLGLTASIIVFIEVANDPQHVICKVCPSRNVKKSIRCCHVADHIQSKKHQKNPQRAAKEKGQCIPLRLGSVKLSYPTPSQPLGLLDLEMTHPDATPSSTVSMPPPCNIDSGDSEVLSSQLWDEFQAEHTIQIDDYFDDIQRRIESSESILSTVLPPLDDELEVEDIDELDLVPSDFKNHGIDVDGQDSAFS